MSENIKVEPTPIQRNTEDVAIELLTIHIQNTNNVDCSVENLKKIYAEFYAVAQALQYIRSKSLKDYSLEKLV